MKVGKHFNMTMSHRFPNGDIVSIQFGTAKEVDSILDAADPVEVQKFSNDLAEEVKKETLQDIKRAIKENKLFRQIWDGTKTASKSQQNEDDAEKELEKL